MNTCEGYEELISAFLDGMLSNQDRLALMEHMARCSVCQNYFNEQIAIHDALMDDMETIQVPAGFAGAVMERVRTAPQEKQPGRTFRWRQWAVLAACCALAAVGIWRYPAAPSSLETVITGEAAADGAGNAMPEAKTALPAPAVQSHPPQESGPAARNTGQMTGAAEPAPQMETQDSADAESPVIDEPALTAESPPELALYQDSESSVMKQNRDALYAGVLTTASPLAADWVEENLDGMWAIGECYTLNAEEYQALKDLLSANSAVFAETAGPAGSEGFLLVAADVASAD